MARPNPHDDQGARPGLARRILRAWIAYWTWLFGLLGLLVGYRWLWGKRSFRVSPSTLASGTPTLRVLAQEWITVPHGAVWERKELDPETPVPHATLFRYEEQSELWVAAMKDVGKALASAGFPRAIFVHGTFVGQDPVSMTTALRSFFPTLPERLEMAVKGIMKRQCDLILRDNGNFLPDYADLFARAAAWDSPAENFLWSSGNHHAARLHAALELSIALSRVRAKEGAAKAGTVVLGHSHAGQVFALLSRLVSEAKRKEPALLLEAIEGTPLATLADRDALARLDDVRIQFVALGSPPRYRYFLGAKMDLLTVVNHRGEEPVAGSASGFLLTRDGDYVQQWGIDGTDFFGAAAWERALNARLDPYLGTGQGVGVWRAASKLRRRLPDAGRTLLVDFGDASARMPNCVFTVFGHGAYTRLAHMLPIARMVSEHVDTAW